MSKDKSLINFINKTSPDKLRVEKDLGYGFVELNITEAQKRQAKADIKFVEDAVVELLRNSRDANSKNIFVASWKKESLRNLVIIDDGDGIPKSLVERIFEARVTSKLNKVTFDKHGIHGRGMALFSIDQNSKKAKVKYCERKKITAVKVVFDTAELPERANQSTWPSFKEKQIKEGPKNIIRTCLEFNLENKNLKIYLGTPTQILSSLRGNNVFASDIKSPKRLQEKAKQLGINVSFRNCQRILHGNIEPVVAMLEQISFKDKNSGRILRKVTDIKLSENELNIILQKIQAIVNEKMEEYFLTVGEKASINKIKNTLKITLPLEIKE